MILCNAKFLTNHDLRGTYTGNFKANIYESIRIKTKVTLKFLKKNIVVKKNTGWPRER